MMRTAEIDLNRLWGTNCQKQINRKKYVTECDMHQPNYIGDIVLTKSA